MRTEHIVRILIKTLVRTWDWFSLDEECGNLVHTTLNYYLS